MLILLSTLSAAAQDPAKVDSKHYRVIYEDASIRVMRVTYDPGEKSVMHEHPFGACVVFLTEFHGKSTTPDGNSVTEDHKAGEVACDPFRPGTHRHLPENIGDKPFELILIERKPATTVQPFVAG
jgi:quercetin dioxygenase-like cupin family protein